jgi:GT2 family glycosyltransferase
MAPPDVAAVIGNHGGERLLAECVESLRGQTLPPAEIVVVDGASTDRSVAVARELGVRILERENRGLGHLYNEGARTTDARFVLLLNNDVALDERCLELLVAALADDEARFAADAHQLDWDGGTTIHARTMLQRGGLVREHLPGLRLDHLVPAETTVPTVAANGASMLVRRELLLDLGGFDETFFMEWEDLDLCWRAWLRGLPTVYAPQARVRHRVGAATSRQHRPRRSASSHHNLVRFALKCLPPEAAARVVGGELLRLPRHPRPVGLGLARVLRELPEIVRLRREIRPSSAHLDWVLAGMPG